MSRRMDRERRELNLPNLWEVGEDHGYRASAGYVLGCIILCPECRGAIAPGEREGEFGFTSHEEWDSPILCDDCGILIPGSLTSDGVRYVRDSDGRTWHGKLMREAFPWAFEGRGS